ncbi:uncharacterized protein FOMMEDRAFT_155180 [Fomitiporia mediterranea MF3/22]|uniref:uncharacterized protein n=1 Tax=Fomitiporia mediterranea (strain MF3/22) TaxID=694068 RepID=UPI0004407F77|nr:uncharacterized protein FOMMEDRAFT_155180 [Fomitiporia mediterranea MF3/22]EJD04048.1 hypothetical protein FOMMEDRAFT_155180 [Fomitiporia mediterranea MF3/22]
MVVVTRVVVLKLGLTRWDVLIWQLGSQLCVHCVSAQTQLRDVEQCSYHHAQVNTTDSDGHRIL